MNERDAVTSHWATLIGINFYAEPLRSLGGCVRDVHGIEAYLKSQFDPIHVEVLTASMPPDISCREPPENAHIWPTFENVTTSLERIIYGAKRGDFVYIHFSGHGTQEEASSFKNFGNKETGNLALVLFNQFNASRISYLYGQDLAKLIKRMVDNGLFVTLVLDCCFSGSVVRHGNREETSIRSIDYDPAIDGTYLRHLSTGGNIQSNSSALRDGRMQGNWLINPDGYLILSACGPHEIAQELTLEGTKSGALSYFLIRTLLALDGTQMTWQSIYDHLRMKFHVYWPRQTPMLFGKSCSSFFGISNSQRRSDFIQVLRKAEGNHLYLDAGHAHGVYEDEDYAVYPLDSSVEVFRSTEKALFIARVTAVGSIQSNLTVTGAKSRIVEPRTRLKAKRLTSLSPWKMPIRLILDEDDQVQLTTIAQSILYLRIFVKNCEGQPCLFNIIRNESQEYEILNESWQQINSLPKIPENQSRALQHLASTLEHIATLKYFQGLENRDSNVKFEQSFRIYLRDAVGNDLEAWSLSEVKEGAMITIAFQNFSNQPLYFALFDIGPSWQIDNLVSGSGEGNSLVVPPRDDTAKHTGKREIAINMTIPEPCKKFGSGKCEDTIKIFITNKPGSFTIFQLPKLPTSAMDLPEPTRRGSHSLLTFLSTINSFRRGAGDNIHDSWATQNIIVRSVTEAKT